MSSKIFKNYQVNIGTPFNIRTPVNFHTIQKAIIDEKVEKDDFESYDDIMSGAQEKADLVVKEAQFEALRLLEDAQNEAGGIRQEVMEEAKRRGYDEGLNEAKKQYEDLIQEAEFIREHAKTEYKQVLESIESNVVDVILEIAKKVIGTDIGSNKESILFSVKQVFERCTNKENAVLRVAPEDYEFITGNREKFLSMVEGVGDVEIKSDPTMKPGSCIVGTPYGSIDGGVHTRFKKIEEAFRQVVGK